MRTLLMVTASLLFWSNMGITQPIHQISLQECYAKVQENFPLSTARQLIRQHHELQQSQIDATTLPELWWNSKARWQSDVVRFPLQLPGLDIPQLPLYNVQTALEANYLLLDGGMTQAKKTLAEAGFQQEWQAIQLELDQLKPRINELVFSSLLLKSKADILRQGLQRLQLILQQAVKSQEHGVASSLELNRIRAEIIQLEAQVLETEQARSAAISTLSVWMQSPLSDSITFILPDLNRLIPTETSPRSEHLLFEQQKKSIAAKEPLLLAAQKPMLSAWAQLGVGYPNPFNFFDNQISPFGALGLALKWRVLDWKQTQRDQEMLRLQLNLVDQRQQAFDQTIDAGRQQILEQLRLSTGLLNKEAELVSLHQQILSQTEAQLRQGSATLTDYLVQENTLRQASLSLALKKLQVDILKINLLIINGKL